MINWTNYLDDKIKLSNNSIQIILSKLMGIDDQDKIYCADDKEYRFYPDICDKITIDRYYNNHLKSQSQINNLRRSVKLKKRSNFFYFISSYRKKWFNIVTYVIKQLKIKVRENIFNPLNVMGLKNLYKRNTLLKILISLT